MSEIAAPADSIEIMLNGEPKTLSMPYGLLLDIARLVPDAQSINDMVAFDANLRDLVIRRMLTSTLKRAVKSEDELLQPEDIELTADDASNIVAFAAEHATHFFLSSASKVMARLERFQKADPQP